MFIRRQEDDMRSQAIWQHDPRSQFQGVVSISSVKMGLPTHCRKFATATKQGFVIFFLFFFLKKKRFWKNQL